LLSRFQVTRVSGCARNGIYSAGSYLVLVKSCFFAFSPSPISEDCSSAGGSLITIEGFYFCNRSSADCQVTISFGAFPCTNVQVMTSNMITCVLSAGSGQRAPFVGFMNSALMALIYPVFVTFEPPTIQRVTGCQVNDADLNSTVACPFSTASQSVFFLLVFSFVVLSSFFFPSLKRPSIVAIEGSGFGPSNALAFIGDQPCQTTSHDPNSPSFRLLCTLPSFRSSKFSPW
jgi:hypothetical protein